VLHVRYEPGSYIPEDILHSHRCESSNLIFRAKDCDTDHSLLLVRIKERFAMSNQRSHRFQTQEVKRSLKQVCSFGIFRRCGGNL
jgi:hypothetical protein